MKKLLFAMIGLLFVCQSSAQNNQALTATDGILSFTVKTVSNGATYSPKNVLAIWIKDATGNFVISRKVMANSRKQHLVKWVANSGYNVTDAITGSTLSSHQTHTVTWDCRDISGNLVADGDYQVWVEYTSRNSANGGEAGPFYSITFHKGTEIDQPVIADQIYFINMTLLYEPTGVGIDDPAVSAKMFELLPNPASNNSFVQLHLEQSSYVNISVYDFQGRRVLEAFDGFLNNPEQKILINNETKQLVKGTYLVCVNTATHRYSQKLIITD